MTADVQTPEQIEPDVDVEQTEQKAVVKTPWSELTLQGLWKNNPALVQLLGLCPLLAVTNTLVNAMGLALATLLVLTISNLTISLIQQWVTKEIRIPVFIMIIASFVTIIQLLMNAFTYELYLSLGIFIPLIVTNCAIIGRAEAYASKNPPLASAVDGFMMGLGFGLVLLFLGAVREILGEGSLFAGAELLFGPSASALTIQVFEFEQHFLLAMLPPGAFIGMGFIIALKNYIDNKAKQQQQEQQPKIERARVTTVN